MDEYGFNENGIRIPSEFSPAGPETAGTGTEYGGSGEEFRGSAEEYFPVGGRESFDYVPPPEDEDSAKESTRKKRAAKQLIQKMGYLVASCVAVVMLATAVPEWASDFKWSSGSSHGPDPYYSDTVTAIVCDAVDRSPVAARMTFRDANGNEVRSARSSSEGEYNVTLPEGEYTVRLTASGYVDSELTFYQPYDGRVEQVFAMSAKLKRGEMRIVLQWGENPSDLDSHLFGVGNDNSYLHVFYSDLYGYANSYADDGSRELLAMLDVDDTSSYGPETITIYDLNTSYIYAVYDYSSGGSLNSSQLSRSLATIQVYTYGNAAPRVFTLPTGEGTWWHVFRIDNGVITPIQKISMFSPANDSGFFTDLYADETPAPNYGIDEETDAYTEELSQENAWDAFTLTDFSYSFGEVPFSQFESDTNGYPEDYFDTHRSVRFSATPAASSDDIVYAFFLNGDESNYGTDWLEEPSMSVSDVFFTIEADERLTASIRVWNRDRDVMKTITFAEVEWDGTDFIYDAFESPIVE